MRVYLFFLTALNHERFLFHFFFFFNSFTLLFFSFFLFPLSFNNVLLYGQVGKYSMTTTMMTMTMTMISLHPIKSRFLLVCFRRRSSKLLSSTRIIIIIYRSVPVRIIIYRAHIPAGSVFKSSRMSFVFRSTIAYS